MAFKLELIALIVFTSVLFSNAEVHHEDLNSEFMIMYEAKDNGIEIEMTVNTTGWIGIGFNNITSGFAMQGADFFLGTVKDGIVDGLDHYLAKNATPYRPIIDKKQNWQIKSGTKTNHQTIIKVFRLLDTEDRDEDVVLKNDEQIRILWAYHNVSDNYNTSMHSHRGSKTLKLDLSSGSNLISTIGINTIVLGLIASFLQGFY